MHKKLLPALKKKEKNPRAKNPQQDQNPLGEKDLSPNLLIPVENEHILVRSRPKIVRFVTWTVYVLGFVFISLLTVSFLIDRNLEKQKEKRDELINSIDALNDTVLEVKSVNHAVSLYKDNKNKDTRFYPVLSKTTDILNELVVVESFSYNLDRKKMVINSRASNPTKFAIMLSKMVEVEEIVDITIKTVELNRGRVEDYIGEFEVNLK